MAKTPIPSSTSAPTPPWRTQSPNLSRLQPTGLFSPVLLVLPTNRVERMWVVDSPSPSSSTPHTPLPQSAVPVLHTPPVLHPTHQAPTLPQTSPPFLPLAGTPSVSASALPGAHMSGRLSGVVSLTDILNLFAKAGGLHPQDPEERRRQRRRSSSVSLGRSSSVDVGGRR